MINHKFQLNVKMDISNMCRSCMKELTSWEKENFNRRAVQMFCFCTNINITDEDNLPKHFCYNCIIKIESSYMYIIEAHKVDATLKNIVSINTSVIVELETCSADTIINHTDNLKLTLPDYKICSAVDNYEQIINGSSDVSNGNDAKETIDSTVDTNNIQFSTKDDKPEIVTENLNTKKNLCPVCRKGFTSKVWFNKHMENEHTENKYACTHCPKTFSKASQLAYHATSHSDERKFACNACGKRYKRRKQLTIHARAHEDIRPFACDKCSMRFKLKSVLKCHIKVHEGERQYLCYFCGWSFAQAGNLKVHLRVHTGEKPFSCAQCGFRAAAACSLRRHLRRHAAARTYRCSHCTKGFYDASGLARHVRTHTGERPYQCPACARTFRDSWTRKTHLMRAHRHTLADIPRMRRDGRLVNMPTHTQA